MANSQFRSNIAAFVYKELRFKVSAETLTFVCGAIDAASLDVALDNPSMFPRRVASISLEDFLKTDVDDYRRHYTVDLFDKQMIPIGSIRVYEEGDCRLLPNASQEATLDYLRRAGLL